MSQNDDPIYSLLLLLIIMMAIAVGVWHLVRLLASL
jgi:hypothetical protein